MMDPDIILFDEPTSALDPEMVGEVLDLIKMVAEENKTMIIVSHEMNFVKSIATRILFLDNGKILFDGSNKEFFNNKNERIKMFLQKLKNKIAIDYIVWYNLIENKERILDECN